QSLHSKVDSCPFREQVLVRKDDQLIRKLLDALIHHSISMPTLDSGQQSLKCWFGALRRPLKRGDLHEVGLWSTEGNSELRDYITGKVARCWIWCSAWFGLTTGMITHSIFGSAPVEFVNCDNMLELQSWLELGGSILVSTWENICSCYPDDCQWLVIGFDNILLHFHCWSQDS
ncbi:unnamed protein product, partial [Linum tenue]